MRSFLLSILVLVLLPLLSWCQVRQRVACIGDSITEGVGVDSGKRYPDVLQQLLGAGYEVRNFGVSARTLLQKGDFPYRNEAAYRAALAWAPDIVVIKLGTNDSKPQNWKWAGEFERDYRALVRSFPKKARVYVCTPIPVFETNWGINDSTVRAAIIPKIRRVAAKEHLALIDLYTAFAGRPQLVFDGVHPNAGGCALIAQTIAGVLKRRSHK